MSSVRLDGIKHIHLLGIGGAGMSGLALLFQAMGYQVTGCDMSQGPYVKKVQATGTQVLQGHDPSHLDLVKADLVAYSSAVSVDNPELVEARRRGIPVLRRAELLSTLFNAREGIGVAGTHGKTTTTSMISLIMEQAGLNPSVAIGGELRELGTNAKLGMGSMMVAELDESDGTFLYFKPRAAVVTNVDWDHVDHYASFEQVLDGFEQFLRGVADDGYAVLCGDDAGVQKLLPRLEGLTLYTCGLKDENQYQARDVVYTPGGGMGYTLFKEGRALGRIELALSGQHFLQDSLCACVVALKQGVTFDVVAAALKDFQGAARRLQLKGEKNDVIVYDDYGHHPREVAATLSALKQIAPHRPLRMIFQPHRFSRTQVFGEQFAQVLSSVDHLYLLPIYPAAEKPIPGVTSEALASRILELGGHCTLVEDLAQALDCVRRDLKDGELLITEGAGDVYRLGEAYLEDRDLAQ